MRILIGVLLITVLVVTMAQAQPMQQKTGVVCVQGCGGFPSANIMYNGVKSNMMGVIKDGRTFLPARESLERMGATVTWVPDQQAFYAQFPKQNRTVKINVGSTTAGAYCYQPGALYGAGPSTNTVTLNIAPFQCAGHVYIPVRSLIEATGGNVGYDQNTRTVIVTSAQQNTMQ